MVDKGKEEIKIGDMVIPGDTGIRETKIDKIVKCRLMKGEISRMWTMRKMSLIPVFVGSLEVLKTKTERIIKGNGTVMRAEQAQRSALLGETRV